MDVAEGLDKYTYIQIFGWSLRVIELVINNT